MESKRNGTISFDKLKWIFQENKSVKESFMFLPGYIGKGTHSIVYKAALRSTPHSNNNTKEEYRAIKVIPLNIIRTQKEEIKPTLFQLKLNSLNKSISLPDQWKTLQIPEQIQKEILIQLVTDHPNIVNLTDVYYSHDNCLYLVMEYCEGGNLFEYWNDNYERIKKNKKNNASIFEQKVAKLFRQIMCALNYCHKNGIIHRDLRPNNIMVVRKVDDEEKIRLKLIDFSLSEALDNVAEKRISNSLEFPFFVAPEIFDNKITNKCDIWSAGVILYTLLIGEMPFNVDNPKNYRNIKPDEIYKAVSLDKSGWKTISLEAKDLISKMICVDSKRLTAEEVLNHKWFTKAEKQTLSFKKPNDQIQFNIESFRSYVKKNGVIKNIFRCLAETLDDKETKYLQDQFKDFDNKEEGFITLSVFKSKMKELFKNKYLESDIEKMFEGIDINLNYKIEYREFLACAISKIPITKIYNHHERLKIVFNKFDSNGDGKINRQELEAKLLHDENDESTRAEIEEFINQCDNNSDGLIDFQEFLAIMRSN